MAGQISDMTGSLSAASRGGSLRRLVRTYGYGTIMFVCLMVLWWGVEGPAPLPIVSNGLYIVMLLVILGLEIWIPYQKKWGDIRNSTRADVIYFLMAAPIDFFAMFLFVGVLAGTAQYHHYLQVFDFWPSEAHILVQLVLVTFAVDFFKYWYHRWTHEIPYLWRYHSIHHSLDRLEMLRASYFYPLDIFLTVGIGTLTLLACGVGYELIVFHNVYAGITGLLNHSNADLECGFFDRFLNSIGHHRAHHSVGEPGRSSNYGSFFNFTDRIFGTRYLPEDQSDFGRLGLDDDYEMPDTVLKQLAVPFRWREIYKPS